MRIIVGMIPLRFPSNMSKSSAQEIQFPNEALDVINCLDFLRMVA